MSIHKAKGGFRVRWREGSKHRSKLIPGPKKYAQQFEDENRRRLIMGETGWWTKGTISFEDFAADWFIRKGPELARRTIKDYSTLIDRHLVPAFGHSELRAVNVKAVEDFISSALAKGTGRRQLRMALSVLGQIMDRAEARGEIQANPLRHVKLPKQNSPRVVKPLTPKTIEAIRAYMLKHKTHEDAVLVSVLAYAGLRPGEALALHWHHIDTKLRVEGAVALGELKATKTESNRSVDLLQPLRTDLNELRMAEGRPTGLIFKGERKEVWTQPMWQNWWRRTWLPAVKGIDPRPRPYDLRHSFASLLIAEGRNVFEIAAQLGHSRPDLLGKTYGHIFSEFEAGDRTSAEERIRQARDERTSTIATAKGNA